MSTYLIEAPRTSDLMPLPPPNDDTRYRWPLQRARREVLDGTWRQQLIEAARRKIGTERIAGWAEPSLARNVADATCTELAVLYDQPFKVTHDTAGAGDYVNEAMRIAGAQAILQRVQAYTIGIGTCYVRVKGHAPALPGGLPRVTYEAVTPDVVLDVERHDGSDQPALVREYAPRLVDGKTEWTADEWDVRDPFAPVYRFLRMTGSGVEVVAESAGDAYPYRRADGRGVLPYVLYHDGPPRIGLHDPHHREALFAGGLDVAVFYWMASHCFADASWPQRAVMGMQPAGGASRDDGGNTAVVHTLDPSILSIFEKMADFDGQPTQWQWAAGADVDTMFAVTDDLAGRLAVEAGVSPTDLHRASPNRSGSAIALTNEGKRRMQARFAGSFKPSDERLAAVTAVVLNSVGGLTLPESGYRVTYGQLPLSVAEQDARRRHAIESRAAGLMTPLEAYMYIHPELSEQDARAALAEIAPPASPAP